MKSGFVSTLLAHVMVFSQGATFNFGLLPGLRRKLFNNHFFSFCSRLTGFLIIKSPGSPFMIIL